MFDLCLLNSQNKAADITLENREKKKKDEYNVSKLKEYNSFLKTTADQLKGTLNIYERRIDRLLNEGNNDYIQAFKKAALRYVDIRDMENVDFGEMMKNENDQILSASAWHFG